MGLNEKEWIREQLNKYPQADKNILFFIGRTIFWNIDNNTDYKNTPECFFTNGYCYYFALMLEHLFEGEMLWHKFHSHIVFVDKNGIAYDAHGVFEDYGEGELLPINLLSDVDLLLFLHIKENFPKQEIKAGNLKTALNVLDYETRNNASEWNIEVTKRMIEMIKRSQSLQRNEGQRINHFCV